MYLTIKEYWLAFEHNSSSHQLVEVEQWSRVGNDAQVISYLCDNQHGSINHNPINLGSQYVTFAWHTVPVHIALLYSIIAACNTAVYYNCTIL